MSIRDRLIEQLTREIEALKEELESFRLEVRSAQTPCRAHKEVYKEASEPAFNLSPSHPFIRVVACVRR